MGIKCSLFGHDFGESTVERDREEQGNEVVSTIREIETCTRCGETRVVSENTEVTTIKTPEDVQEEAESDEPEMESGADIVDAEAEEPVSDTEITAGLSEDTTEYESAAKDDGVILEDDTEERPERETGEWPESTASDGSEQGESDSTERTRPQSEETEPAETDGERSEELVSSEGRASSTDSGTDEESPADDEAEVWSSTQPDLEDVTTGVEGADDGTGTVADGEFRCTECGFATPVASSSLRKGDFCPECHQGMLIIERD